jgi:putative transposase
MKEEPIFEPKGYIGIDRNTTGFIAVIADPISGMVWKLGKSCQHLHHKYSNIRRRLQKQSKHKEIKDIKKRERATKLEILTTRLPVR